MVRYNKHTAWKIRMGFKKKIYWENDQHIDILLQNDIQQLLQRSRLST